MKLKTKRIFLQKCTFQPNTTTFPTRNLHSTDLQGGFRGQHLLSVTGDPKIGGGVPFLPMKPKTERFSPKKCTSFSTFRPEKTQIIQTEICIPPVWPPVSKAHTCFTATGDPRKRGGVPFLPMKPKKQADLPQKCTFLGHFSSKKTTNFPTRNLHSTNLPAISGVNTCFTVAADPEIGGWGPIPTHETQNRRIFPPKCTFFGNFQPKNANFPNRNLHSARLFPVSRAHTCFTATRDPEIGGRVAIPAYETQNQADLPQKCTFLGHFSSKSDKFSNWKSAFHQSARSFRGQHLLDHDR